MVAPTLQEGLNLAKPRTMQRHHITYDPERTVIIYKGEHWLLTRLQWRKYISKGFIEALQQFIQDKQETAVSLDEEYYENKTHKKPDKPV